MSKPAIPLSATDAAVPKPHVDVALVIFDFDGVVADSEVISLGTLQTTLAEFGLDWPLEDVRARFLGSSLATISDYVAQHGPNGDHGFADAWQSRLFASFREKLEPVTGIVELLQSLSGQGIRYCIASSSSLERIAIALDAMGLADAFPNVFSAEQVAHGKPAPDLFLLAAQRMQVDPRHCLVVEDSAHGVRAARAAGMRAFGFLGGQHLRGIEAGHAALLRQCGAERAVTTLDAVLQTE